MKPGNEPGEDLNIRKIHGAIIREKAEPREMFRAIPWWLKHLIYAPLCIWGIWYLIIASGGFRWSEYSEGYFRTVIPETSQKIQTAPISNWNSVMPAQGATLDDRKIAVVLSYIRSEWDNSAPPVTAESVTTLREKFKDHAPWTEADLKTALSE